MPARGPAAHPGRDAASLRPSEAFNHVVRDHGLRTPWEHQDEAALLHRWFNLLNAEFFEGKLPVGFLRLERAHCTTLSRYRSGRNGVGAHHDIQLNSLYLDAPRYDLIARLLHEMVHQWQELFGRRAQRRLHNKELAAKCAAIGIPCETYACYTQQYDEPFLSLLRREGIDFGSEPPEPARPPAGQSKLKKWSCGCTNIRAAVEVRATCLTCGRHFRRAEKRVRLNSPAATTRKARL